MVRRFAEVMATVASMSGPLWTKQGDWDGYSEILSLVKLCEVILSPHGNSLSELQLGAWGLMADKGKCSCVIVVAPMPPDFLVRLQWRLWRK